MSRRLILLIVAAVVVVVAVVVLALRPSGESADVGQGTPAPAPVQAQTFDRTLTAKIKIGGPGHPTAAASGGSANAESR